MTDEPSPLGPISYLIVEFPGNKMTGDGVVELVDLVDRGVIRVLDLMFVPRDADGATAVVELTDVDHDGSLDIAVFEGVSSGLLDESDAEDAGAAIEPGSSAAVLLFENRWAVPFVPALRAGSAQLVAAGYVPQDVVVHSLDAAEARTS